MTEIETREMEILKRDITSRMFELEAFSHALELLFFECPLQSMERGGLEPGLLFASQKRLYGDLHSQIQELIAKDEIHRERCGS